MPGSTLPGTTVGVGAMGCPEVSGHGDAGWAVTRPVYRSHRPRPAPPLSARRATQGKAKRTTTGVAAPKLRQHPSQSRDDCRRRAPLAICGTLSRCRPILAGFLAAIGEAVSGLLRTAIARRMRVLEASMQAMWQEHSKVFKLDAKNSSVGSSIHKIFRGTPIPVACYDIQSAVQVLLHLRALELHGAFHVFCCGFDEIYLVASGGWCAMRRASGSGRCLAACGCSCPPARHT